MHTFSRVLKAGQQPKPVNCTKANRTFFEQSRNINSILRVQGVNDNYASWRLPQPNAEEFKIGPSCSPPTVSAEDFSQIPLYLETQTKVQPKLVPSVSRDLYEEEADRTADQVMQMPDPRLHHDFNSGCPVMRRKPKKQQGETLELKTGSAQERNVGNITSTIIQDIKSSSGSLLNSELRAFFEPRFGFDFSQVRVHRDKKATESALSLNASAYTIGSQIVFQERVCSERMGRKMVDSTRVNTCNTARLWGPA